MHATISVNPCKHKVNQKRAHARTHGCMEKTDKNATRKLCIKSKIQNGIEVLSGTIYYVYSVHGHTNNTAIKMEGSNALYRS